ncbi:pyridoxal-phosphate dependent enzyme [Streptomyces sp. 3MP-14]|uniref:threonine ammonia-lyase n=1 Tax=Streptomyces mimosae TaxID=2586635 RepID=A0A5N6AJY0_9ACTN|nr:MULTISPECIES: pyridoxal-phosphate dependent enzyme [Streptomyces]KAB8168525.1 pyridoxal-phosphate dependent enzyme [Streptomyces mimosae]KAB8178194.1 pyridoxal-phosphate dependent enzyme [Streptomyces sp. 3MP-14]
MSRPTISDALAARRVLAGQLPPTPMWNYPALDATTGATVLVKHENVQPTGAFKVRGGLNLLAGLDAEARRAGIVGYSTGNHAQSLAFAARQHGTRCTIVMPVNPNPCKAAAVRALGAELIEAGADMGEAAERARLVAEERGARLVSAADEPALVAGVATAYLEIFEQAPDLDAVVVPVGGGSGAAAACLVAQALAPRCEVIAVQSAASPAAHDSWRAGRLLTRPNATRAEGLATGCGFALTQGLMTGGLADFLLVDDDRISEAQWVLMRDAHTLAEGAGAAGLAALLAHPERFSGRRVAVVCTGANASERELRAQLGLAAAA